MTKDQELVSKRVGGGRGGAPIGARHGGWGGYYRPYGSIWGYPGWGYGYGGCAYGGCGYGGYCNRCRSYDCDCTY